MSLIKKLAGQTALYGLSSVIGRTLNYLLVPLYTTVFAPGAYGIVTELYAYVAFLNILYIYGLETAYFRFSEEDEERAFGNAFTSILITSVLLSGSIFLFAQSLADALGYPNQTHLIKWLAGILAVDAIVAIPFARLRKQGKALKFAAYKLINIILNIGLNLFFIVFCPELLEKNPTHWISEIYNSELGVGYVFLSNLIANASYILFFLPELRIIRVRLSRTEWVKMMKYAWPILIIGFAGVTNEMLSRAILKYRLPEGFYEGYSNVEILGIFGACYKLSIFMALAVQAFRYAFEPFFFGAASDKNSPKVFSQVMNVFVLFTAFSWLAVSLFLPVIAPVFLRQPEYLNALDAVPWLLGGGMFLGIFYNLSIWYKLTDNTIYGGIISLIGAALTLVLNWILIPVLGYMGSAMTTLFSYLLMVIISYLWGRKHYPISYDLFRVLTYVSLAAGGIWVNSKFNSFGTSLTIILLFLILAFILERKHLKKLMP